MSNMTESPYCEACGERHNGDARYTPDNLGPFCVMCFEAYEIANKDDAQE